MLLELSKSYSLSWSLNYIGSAEVHEPRPSGQDHSADGPRQPGGDSQLPQRGKEGQGAAGGRLQPQRGSDPPPLQAVGQQEEVAASAGCRHQAGKTSLP